MTRPTLLDANRGAFSRSQPATENDPESAGPQAPGEPHDFHNYHPSQRKQMYIRGRDIVTEGAKDRVVRNLCPGHYEPTHNVTDRASPRLAISRSPRPCNMIEVNNAINLKEYNDEGKPGSGAYTMASPSPPHAPSARRILMSKEERVVQPRTTDGVPVVRFASQPAPNSYDTTSNMRSSSKREVKAGNSFNRSKRELNLHNPNSFHGMDKNEHNTYPSPAHYVPSLNGTGKSGRAGSKGIAIARTGRPPDLVASQVDLHKARQLPGPGTYDPVAPALMGQYFVPPGSTTKSRKPKSKGKGELTASIESMAPTPRRPPTEVLDRLHHRIQEVTRERNDAVTRVAEELEDLRQQRGGDMDDWTKARSGYQLKRILQKGDAEDAPVVVPSPPPTAPAGGRGSPKKQQQQLGNTSSSGDTAATTAETVNVSQLRSSLTKKLKKVMDERDEAVRVGQILGKELGRSPAFGASPRA
eukprot:PhM_4_TR377/c0_g1_i1/m.67976